MANSELRILKCSFSKIYSFLGFLGNVTSWDWQNQWFLRQIVIYSTNIFILHMSMCFCYLVYYKYFPRLLFLTLFVYRCFYFVWLSVLRLEGLPVSLSLVPGLQQTNICFVNTWTFLFRNISMYQVIAAYVVHQSEWFVNLINVVQYRYYILNNLSFVFDNVPFSWFLSC